MVASRHAWGRPVDLALQCRPLTSLPSASGNGPAGARTHVHLHVCMYAHTSSYLAHAHARLDMTARMHTAQCCLLTCCAMHPRTHAGNLIYSNNHIRSIWRLMETEGGTQYTLPAQPLSTDDGKPIPADSNIRLTCKLELSTRTCKEIKDAVKLGVVKSVR